MLQTVLSFTITILAALWLNCRRPPPCGSNKPGLLRCFVVVSKE
jgi:hypothetical protein